MMLDKLKSIAVKTKPLRPLFALAAICGFVTFVTTLFKLTAYVHESYLIPSAVSTLWAMFAWVMISSFQSIPDVNPSLSVVKRLKVRFLRLFFYLLAIGFLILSAFICLVTFRMLGVWFRH